MYSKIVFLDTEAVTLKPGPDVLWEVAMIVRVNDVKPDMELRWQLRPNMDRADPTSLVISGFDRRFAVKPGEWAHIWSTTSENDPYDGPVSRYAAVIGMNDAIHGAHVYGIVPSFDTIRLESMFWQELQWNYPTQAGPNWHYQLHDVEDLAMGYLRGRVVETGLRQPDVDPTRWTSAMRVPYDSLALSTALGVTPPAESHTAMGDARWARDLYDAVMTP